MTKERANGRSHSEDAHLVALSFKVSFEFRRWFKMQALQRNLTMTEFLVKASESYAGFDRTGNCVISLSTEIRK